MRIIPWIVVNGCRLGMNILCRIDNPDLAKVPEKGPLIFYSNHTGMVEVPVIYTELHPRPLTGLAKKESWDNWFLKWIFNILDAIPIRRGEADMEAMHSMLDALEKGRILGLSPEGTRNKTGALKRAHPGVVLLALKSGAPLLPIAHWGGENFRINLRRLKRTDFHIRCGRRFFLDTKGEKITKEVRQQMVDEIMYQLARLMPEKYRGAYSDFEKATEKYLRFVD